MSGRGFFKGRGITLTQAAIDPNTNSGGALAITDNNGVTWVHGWGAVIDGAAGNNALGLVRGTNDNVTLNPTPVGLPTQAFAGVAALMYGLRSGGATMDRIRAAADNADGQAALTLGALLALARLTGWNGATWDRLKTLSAANLATFSSVGALMTRPGDWSITNAPAANTIATITKAGVAGTRHVCTSLLGAMAAPLAATPVTTLVLRDGASGVGAILWSTTHMAGVGFADEVQSGPVNIVGTAGNAMTLEWLAAPGANNFQSVALTGYDAT